MCLAAEQVQTRQLCVSMTPQSVLMSQILLHLRHRRILSELHQLRAAPSSQGSTEGADVMGTVDSHVGHAWRCLDSAEHHLKLRFREHTMCAASQAYCQTLCWKFATKGWESSPKPVS